MKKRWLVAAPMAAAILLLLGRLVYVGQHTLARQAQLSDCTLNSSRLRNKVKGKDNFAVRALDPARKGEVCRAIRQITGIYICYSLQLFITARSGPSARPP
jgi:hypothetical protein